MSEHEILTFQLIIAVDTLKTDADDIEGQLTEFLLGHLDSNGITDWNLVKVE